MARTAEVIPMPGVEAGSKKAKKAEAPKEEPKTFLPEPFEVSEASRRWFTNRYGVIPAPVKWEIMEEFVDYWSMRTDTRAKRTARGWQATWKNRMRRAETDPRTPLGRYLRHVGWTPPELRGIAVRRQPQDQDLSYIEEDLRGYRSED